MVYIVYLTIWCFIVFGSLIDKYQTFDHQYSDSSINNEYILSDLTLIDLNICSLKTMISL